MLRDLAIALILGIGSGVLAIAAVRRQVAWLGWIMLAPLAVATYALPPLPAAMAAAFAGALITGARVWGVYRFAPVFEIGAIGMGAVVFAVTFGLAAWLWPDGTPAWGALILPLAAAVVSTIPRSLAGRQDDPLLATQEHALPVVHLARLGGDAVVPGLLGLAASIPAMLVVQWPPSIATLGAVCGAAALVLAALAYGHTAYRRAVQRGAGAMHLRVAAVAIDPPPRPGSMFAAMTEEQLAATIGRYGAAVAAAAAEGARLIVLPEMAAVVTSAGRERWLAAVSEWAKGTGAIIVADDFDAEARRNRLTIVDEAGRLAGGYDKQHPMPSVEPKPPMRMAPALRRGSPAVSGLICHDLDLADWVRPVRRAGGVLAVAANEWKAIADIHHRVTVWAAVMAGVPVVRAATHGTSAIFEASGRVVAEASSSAGPVVLVADVAV